jgi:hypothetical protein
MSLTRIAATGRGRISARLVIEGLDHEFVSDARMECTTVDDRVRVKGLLLDGLVLTARADIMRARLTGEPLNVQIADLDRLPGKRHGRVTRALVRAPSQRAYLDGDLGVADTSMTLKDTSDLDASGVVHINTEAIRYTGKTSTTLTGLTRAWWATAAQAHYVADGEGVLDALVTNRIVSLEGRRAYLYLYGEGDSPTGSGNLRWRGIIASDVKWQNGICSMSIDPITRLLEQPIGGDLGGTVGARGIKYTTSFPFVVVIVHYPSAAEEVRATAEVVGFFETQQEFCDEVNAQIAAALTAASISLGADAILEAQARVDAIDIVYVTHTGTRQNIGVFVQDGLQQPRGDGWDTTSQPYWYNDTGGVETMMGDRSWAPPASTRYYLPISAPVPRGAIGFRAAPGRERSGGARDIAALEYLLPLSGTVIPSVSSVLLSDGDEDSVAAPITISSVSGRSVYVRPGFGYTGSLVYGKTTSWTLGRNVTTGTVLDFATELFASSPTLANTGAMPLVLSIDLSWTDGVSDSIAAQPLAQGRGFFAIEEPLTVGEFVEPELLAVGAYQRLSLTGAIEWARMGPPLVTDEAVYSIDDSSAAMSMERAPDGVLGHVVYRMGYSPREDEWDDRTLTYRDVQATSPTRIPIALEIAQRSTSTRTIRAGDDWASIDRAAVGRMAMNAFALFGTPVSTITVPTDARYMNARIGDVVSLSSSALPDTSDGCSAVSNRTGLVTGHSLDLASGAVTLLGRVRSSRAPR